MFASVSTFSKHPERTGAEAHKGSPPLSFPQLFSFQVLYTGNTAESQQYYSATVEEKEKRRRGILEIDFLKEALFILEKDRISLSEAFLILRNHVETSYPDECSIFIKFNSSQWEVTPQNVAEKTCIQHLLECIINGSSIGEALHIGKEKGIIGLDKVVHWYGGIRCRAADRMRLHEQYLILVPGKLFFFKNFDTIGKHVQYVTSLLGASVQMLHQENEFQVLIPGSDTISLISSDDADAKAWMTAIETSIQYVNQAARAADIVLSSRKKHRSLGSKMNMVQWNNMNIDSNRSQFKGIGCDDASTDTGIAEANQNLKSDISSQDRYNVDSSLPQEAFSSNNNSVSNRDMKITGPRKQSTAMTCLENALNEMSMAIRHIKVANKNVLTFSPRKSYRGPHEQHNVANWKHRLNTKVDYVDALVSPRMYDAASQCLGSTLNPCNVCVKSDMPNLRGTEIRTSGVAPGPQQVKVGHQSEPRREFHQRSKIGNFHQEPSGRELEQQCHSHIPCYSSMGNIQHVVSALQECKDKPLDANVLQTPRPSLPLTGGAQDLDLRLTHNAGLGTDVSASSCKFSANRNPGLHHWQSTLLPDQRVEPSTESRLPGLDLKSSSVDSFPSQEHRNTFQQRISDQLIATANVQHACAQPNNLHQSNIDCSTRQQFTNVMDSGQPNCVPLKLNEPCLSSASSSDVYSISKWHSQTCPHKTEAALASAKSQAGNISLVTTQHSRIDTHGETARSVESVQGLSMSTIKHNENGQYQINSQEIQNVKTIMHERCIENPLEITECENSHFNCSAVTDIGEEVNGFPMKNVYSSMIPGNRVEKMSEDIERYTLMKNVSRSNDLVMPIMSCAYKDVTSGHESNKMQNRDVINQQLPSMPISHAAAQYSEMFAVPNNFKVSDCEYRKSLGGPVDAEISNVCTRQDCLASTRVSEMFQESNLNEGKNLSLETLPKVQVSDIAELVNKLRMITSGGEATLGSSPINERSSSESGNDTADSVYLKKSSDLQAKLPVIDEVIPTQMENSSLPIKKTQVVTEPAVLNAKNAVELHYLNLLTGDGSCGISPITLRSSDGELIILGKERQSSDGSATFGGGSEVVHLFNERKQSDKALKDFPKDASWSKIPGTGLQGLGSSTNGKGEAWSLAILKPGAPAQIFKFQTV